MKTLSVLVAIALGLGIGSALAQPNTTISPGKIPKLRHVYVPKYDIVTGKAGLKIKPSGALQGLNPQPLPPGKAVLKRGAIKSIGGPDT